MPQRKRSPRGTHPRPGRHARWGLILLISWCCCVAAGPAQDDFERMEKFLDRLGLADLRVAQLEQTLDAPIAPTRKQQLARELADMYAQRLMASADDSTRYEGTLGRITSLLQRFPQANTTSLQVMMLQADYNRAEALMTAWIGDPSQSAQRDQAKEILLHITPQLVQLQDQLNRQTNELLTMLEDLPEGDALQAKEAELRRVQAVAARATYFAGWSNYYLGLAQQTPRNAPPYTTARDIFLKLLGIEDEALAELDAEWLGLESIWRARAVIGLGLSLAACDDLEGCARCFQVLEDATAPEEIRDQAPYWYVRALLGAQEWARAMGYAQDRIQHYQPPATQGKISLCVALVREAFATASPNAQQRQLGDLGLLGLARLDQLSAISELIDKYQITADARSGFVLLWAQGQQQFAAAEKSRAAADYEAAVETLQRALRSPDTKSLATPAARCRYTLGWALYRLDRLEEAAREFTSAFPGLFESKDELAVETASMAFAANRKLAESNPRFVSAASDAARRLQQNFPNHPYAQRATYELNKLLEDSDPETMIAQIKAIAPGSENYALARYDLCQLLHRLWNKERSDPAKAAARLDELQAAVETYLSKVRPADPEKQLRACLLGADAALRSGEPQPDRAASLLDQAQRSAQQLPASNASVLEYHYRLLELATTKGDATARRQQAQWITDNASGSRYEQAGLVIVANALDQQIREAATDNRATLNTQAYSTYSRLVQLLGDAQDDLAGSKNAQIAASRLAHYAAEVGKPGEAAQLLDRLLQVQPRDRKYLQRAAQAHLQAGQYQPALSHLRTLLAGLPAGSAAWYEAKYQQLQALGQTDVAQARKVYQQFRVLHPDQGGDTWKAKFTQLASKW